MFLEDLLDIGTEDFINVGKRLLGSESIRFYIKHVFFEVLGQIEIIDSEIETNNKADIDYDDIIINALEGKALCVYNKLMASGTGFKNAIKKF